MQQRILSAQIVCVVSAALAFGASSCSSKTDPSPPAAPHAKAPLAASVMPAVGRAVELAPKGALGAEANELSPIQERGLLSFVDRDAPLVLRFPHVEKLGEMWKHSPLAAWFATPASAIALGELRASLSSFTAPFAKPDADLDAFLQFVPKMQGELVCALERVELGGATPSASVRVLYDAGTQADALQILLAKALPDLAHRANFNLKPITVPWGFEASDDALHLWFAREGTKFVLRFDPAGAPTSGPALAVLELEHSFAATDVVRSTPDLASSDAVPCVEAYVQLDPVWSAVKSLAGADAVAALEASGTFAIHGASVALGLDGKGCSETFTWNSPGAHDLLSRALLGAPLDASLARWVDPGARSAGLVSFDLKAVFDGLTAAMPKDARREFERDFAAGGQRIGLDLRGEFIDNLGPTFAYWSDSTMAAIDPSAAPKVLFAIAVRDESKAKHLVDALIAAVGLASNAHTTTYQNRALTTLALPALRGPDGSPTRLAPSWCIDHGALVIASDDGLLRSAVRAAADSPGSSHVALRRALAQSGQDVFALSYTQGASQAGDTMVTGRRTAFGWTLAQHRGDSAVLSTSAVALSAGVAAVAIPRLLATRIEVNEVAAVAELQKLAKAEGMFKTAVLVDADGDRHGEYGELAELCGVEPPRGAKKPVDPPILANQFREWSNGSATRSGYLFKVELDRATGAQSIDVDRAEQRFVAFAWPSVEHTSGTRVFAVDAAGAVWVSSNDANGQHYSGTAHAPSREAAWAFGKPGAIDPAAASWRGGDGGTWTWYEMPSSAVKR